MQNFKIIHSLKRAEDPFEICGEGRRSDILLTTFFNIIHMQYEILPFKLNLIIANEKPTIYCLRMVVIVSNKLTECKK